MPIGKPIANCTIHLLDSFLQPVPIGSLGEIYIGGPGLARGYLNQPALTEEAFISDPLSPTAGARLYKTGDLARYLPDGNLDFKGRIDHQVKIRGYRIELGEIEAALLDQEAVSSAAVVTRKTTCGTDHLVAYVVPNGLPDSTGLLQLLRERLPAYMIPSAILFLSLLPRTPNGKLDRARLPTPEAAPESPAAAVAPRTALERLIAEAWCQQLNRERIGIHESFFDLGGDSLQAMRIVSRLKAQRVSGISLQALFSGQTIAEVASICSLDQA